MPCWISSSYWGTCLWPTISVPWKPYCNTLCSCLFSTLFSQLYKPLLLPRPACCSSLAPKGCLSEKQALTTHWTPRVFYSRCLFLIAASVCSRSGVEAKLVNHRRSGNILLVEVQSSFFCLFWHWHYSQTSWWPSFSEENSKLYFKILDLQFGSVTCLSNSRPSPQAAFTFGAVWLPSSAFLQTSGIKLVQEKPKAYETTCAFCFLLCWESQQGGWPRSVNSVPSADSLPQVGFPWPPFPLKKRHKEGWKPRLQERQLPSYTAAWQGTSTAGYAQVGGRIATQCRYQTYPSLRCHHTFAIFRACISCHAFNYISPRLSPRGPGCIGVDKVRMCCKGS